MFRPRKDVFIYSPFIIYNLYIETNAQMMVMVMIFTFPINETIRLIIEHHMKRVITAYKIKYVAHWYTKDNEQPIAYCITCFEEGIRHSKCIPKDMLHPFYNVCHPLSLHYLCLTYLGSQNNQL